MDTNMMVTPDVQGIANALATQKTNTEVGTAILSKALDTSEQSGEAMVKMMENSVMPWLGGNIDASV